MIWIFCIILPPLAIIRTGRMVSLGLNIFLTFCGIIPGIIHAFMVVSDWKANGRTNKIIKAIQNESKSKLSH